MVACISINFLAVFSLFTTTVPRTPIYISEPGADPGFQVRGAHLKKMRRAEGDANIFGVFLPVYYTWHGSPSNITRRILKLPVLGEIYYKN